MTLSFRFLPLACALFLMPATMRATSNVIDVTAYGAKAEADVVTPTVALRNGGADEHSSFSVTKPVGAQIRKTLRIGRRLAHRKAGAS